jgi:hypothetical protein
LTGGTTTGGIIGPEAGAFETTGAFDGKLSRTTGGIETLSGGAAEEEGRLTRTIGELETLAAGRTDEIGTPETETKVGAEDGGKTTIAEADDWTETADGVTITTMLEDVVL